MSSIPAELALDEESGDLNVNGAAAAAAAELEPPRMESRGVQDDSCTSGSELVVGDCQVSLGAGGLVQQGDEEMAWYWIQPEWAGSWCGAWRFDGNQWIEAQTGAEGPGDNALHDRGGAMQMQAEGWESKETCRWSQDQDDELWEANGLPQRPGKKSADGSYRGDWQRGGSKWSHHRGIGLSHGEVPRRLSLEEWSKAQQDKDSVTTLMVRNVPNRYDRAMLMQELDDLGFQDKYDFVYLPIDSSTHWNVGYAFVNFDEPKDAADCMARLEGHQFIRFRHNNKRVAQVSVAHIQGLEKNLAHCSGTSLFLLRPWLRPWVRKWARKDMHGHVDHAPMYGEMCELDGQSTASQHGVESSPHGKLWASTVRRLAGSNGGRRLQFMPDSSKGRGRNGLSPALHRAVGPIAEDPELARMEIEVLGAGGEPSVVTTPGQLWEGGPGWCAEAWRQAPEGAACSEAREANVAQVPYGPSECDWETPGVWTSENGQQWQAIAVFPQRPGMEGFTSLGWQEPELAAPSEAGGQWLGGEPHPLSESDVRFCFLCSDHNATTGSSAEDSTSKSIPSTKTSSDTCDDSTKTSFESDDVGGGLQGGGDAGQGVGFDGPDDQGENNSKLTAPSVTTLMIHNVPGDYTQDAFLEELESLGIQASCDFVYMPQLPMDPDSSWNVGCASLNFSTVEDVAEAKRVLSGHRWKSPSAQSAPPAVVTEAVVQGHGGNLHYYTCAAPSHVDWGWVGPAANQCMSQHAPALPDVANMSRSGMQGVQVPLAVSRTPSPSPERGFADWNAVADPSEIIQCQFPDRVPRHARGRSASPSPLSGHSYDYASMRTRGSSCDAATTIRNACDVSNLAGVCHSPDECAGAVAIADAVSTNDAPASPHVASAAAIDVAVAACAADDSGAIDHDANTGAVAGVPSSRVAHKVRPGIKGGTQPRRAKGPKQSKVPPLGLEWPELGRPSQTRAAR